jgi:type I restriction-modification system DNA methylase subunit
MTSQMKNTAPASIQKLVETFEKNLGEYRSSKNETELRREFLDKFFTALGWDVDNLQGAREAEKEVAHEFSVEIDGQQKKADYAFRIKRDSAIAEKFDFLVEAKKPSVRIETDLDAAFQIRRYGWSAGIPINILTDFEHFAVYDCRVKPKYGDKAVLNRQALFHYKEYIEKWDEIVSLFSPEAIRAGSLSEYVKSIKGKRGTADVDDDFLQEIERWRELLAKNIASNNEWIDISGLNYAVQMIIDRIIFLRICEERSIEPENQLFDLVTQSPTALASRGTSPKFDGTSVEFGGGREGVVYKELCSLFKRADTKYNSGLFHFAKESGEASRSDDLTLRLVIDDKTLKDIILNLYYPKSPYAFLYIPSDILGQVYERFLGKVIRLTDGHRAKVEEKPEVRKAGGVFYTPTFIVTYIVINTLGKLINQGLGKSMTPADVAKLKIVDPACGSGTFLLGAFEYLLVWHLKWYSENDPEKWVKNKSLVKVGNDYRLTTAKKKEILLNNIFGVDIDAQAVEVTKLSLLLKVLENASGQLELGMERILPDLGDNIKCGNSLVDEDYFEGKLMVDEEERARVNAFDWKAAFPEVFAQGGFDVVIGNPPYGASFTLEDDLYFSKSYKTFSATKDLYTCFIEKALAVSKEKGRISYIVPSGWTGGPQYSNLRSHLLKYQVENLVLLPFDIFKDAYIDTLIFVIENSEPNDDHNVETYTYPKREKLEAIDIKDYKIVPQKNWGNSDGSKFVLDPETLEILSRIKKTSARTLNEVVIMRRGVLFDADLLHNKKESEKDYRYFEGDVYRYRINLKIEQWIEFGENLKEKPKETFWFEGERILLRRLVNRQQRLMSCLADQTFITNKNLYSIISKSVNGKIMLALLNSKLLSFLYIKQVTQAAKDDFPQVTIKDILSLPFPQEEVIKAYHDKIVSLVESMLAFHKSLASAQSPHEKERLERQIKSTDMGIDKLVYELYGLNEEEIKIVES